MRRKHDAIFSFYLHGNTFAPQKCSPGRQYNLGQTMCKQSALQENKNELSIRNNRLWQAKEVRNEHDAIMRKRENSSNLQENAYCQHERAQRTVVFPAVQISQEIELVEDTTCIDTNRDEFLKSFCAFTSDLDELFELQNISQKAGALWPNLCCKERRGAALEVCNDPSGKVCFNNSQNIAIAISSPTLILS